jgi:hypothetical protein
VTGPDLALAIAVAAAVLSVAFYLGQSYGARTLTRDGALLFVAAVVVVGTIAVLTSSSNGLVRLVIGPAFLIGSGLGILYWDRTRIPRPDDPDARRFGWLTIATGIGTAVVTLLSIRGN